MLAGSQMRVASPKTTAGVDTDDEMVTLTAGSLTGGPKKGQSATLAAPQL